MEGGPGKWSAPGPALALGGPAAGGAYRAPPDRQTPELDLKGPTSKGRGYRKGGEGEREGRQVSGRKGREEGEGTPVCIFKFFLE